MQKHSLEGDALSQSDSTTYYEDLLSCSENSTDEGDIVYLSHIDYLSLECIDHYFISMKYKCFFHIFYIMRKLY